jgi:hypothetical protein
MTLPGGRVVVLSPQEIGVFLSPFPITLFLLYFSPGAKRKEYELQGMK